MSSNLKQIERNLRSIIKKSKVAQELIYFNEPSWARFKDVIECASGALNHLKDHKNEITKLEKKDV